MKLRRLLYPLKSFYFRQNLYQQTGCIEQLQTKPRVTLRQDAVEFIPYPFR